MKGRVSISVYFAVFIACILIIDRTGLAVFALLCVAVHECGHIAVLSIMRVPVEKVSFRLFGINIVVKNASALSYGQEAALSLAGSTANIITSVPAFIFYKAGIFPLQSGTFFLFSVILGGFNLLPITSLDGGRVLEAVLLRKMSCEKAEVAVGAVSAVFIVPLAVLGILLIIKTGYNISLLICAVYLAAALFVKSGFILIPNNAIGKNPRKNP